MKRSVQNTAEYQHLKNSNDLASRSFPATLASQPRIG